MADGFLEKRMEDYLAGRLKPARKKKFQPRPYPGPPPMRPDSDANSEKQ